MQRLLAALILSAATVPALAASPADLPHAQVGPRPFFLLDAMPDGELKTALEQCGQGPFFRSEFSIGHRGAPMQFPEHTRESYVAADRMGAGIQECDVTFTADKELVCRHSQCDLHTTTDILLTDLAGQCSEPFTPASGDTPASAKCCTSDITLAEYRTLVGKMDAADTSATTVEEYVGGGVADWRTELYEQSGTLMTHAESIELFKEMGVRMTPELKSADVEMPFDGFSQEDYAQKLVDEYVAAGVPASDVFAQSFDLADIEYWIANAPEFGAQAVYLDDRYDEDGFDHTDPSTWDVSMAELKERGVEYLAPPLWMLVAPGEGDGYRPVPSVYAEEAKAAGLKLITWTLERSGPLASGGGWYYQTTAPTNDADALVLLDVLAKDVGVEGVFSDWPGTTTFYANCMGL